MIIIFIYHDKYMILEYSSDNFMGVPWCKSNNKNIAVSWYALDALVSVHLCSSDVKRIVHSN